MGSGRGLDIIAGLLLIPCLFRELARAGGEDSLGFPSRSAGLDPGVGLSVGDHIF